MTGNNITTGAQTLTAAGPAAGTLDISGMSGDYELLVEVIALSAASGVPKARIVIEDTVNGFTAALPVCEFGIEGPITAGASVTETRRIADAPSMRIGTASAALRCNVAALEGTTPSITLRAQLFN